jgi:hypothetical protein
VVVICAILPGSLNRFLLIYAVIPPEVSAVMAEIEMVGAVQHWRAFLEVVEDRRTGFLFARRREGRFVSTNCRVSLRRDAHLYFCGIFSGMWVCDCKCGSRTILWRD